ncbi:MAG: NAD(P)H-binding protein [Geobacter sp.]|nr:NAD(P)H-binding protein [Geobacter sp.]
MYAITGATGNIGSKVADILLDRGERVRLIGRDAGRLQRFVDKGAEAAVGDLKDTPFLSKAFKGTTAVFAMIPPNVATVYFRAYQNEVGTSIATAIVNAGVPYVVNLSSQGADLPGGTGPIVGLRDQEARLNGLEGVHVLHLRCTFFMENLLAQVRFILERGYAGLALRGDQPIAMIATKDIAARVVKHLVTRDYSGKTVRDLLGQRDLTLNGAIAILGRRIGRPDLKYVQLPSEEAARWMVSQGVSSDVSRLFVEMSRGLNDGIFAVGLQRTAENTTPTRIEEFADTFAAAYEAATLRHAA